MQAENKLPERITCLKCKSRLVLDEKERTERKVVCPKCNNILDFNDQEGILRNIQYAGFWRRLIAILIDDIIVWGITLVVLSLLPRASTINLIRNQREQVLIVWSSLVLFLYFAPMESLKGGTYGKLIMKIKVTNYDGQNLTYGESAFRNFMKIISALTVGVGFLMAGFTKKKQALHDIAGRCLVVRK